MIATLENRATHATTNDELLSRLHEAKQSFGGYNQHKELLQDPEINELAFRLVEANKKWIGTCVRKEKNGHGYRDTEEELESLALFGNGGERSDVRGVLGAILAYDYGRYGVSSFTPYLARAIHNVLMPREKQEREADSTVPLEGQSFVGQSWVDRHARQPREVAIDQELLGKVDEAIAALPQRNREVARFVIDYILAHGEKPTGREIAEARVPPVTRQMGEVLGKETVAMLKEELERRNPQLAEEGIGGWDELKAVFGIHKHVER
jgi:hypothetical protein